MRKKIGMVFQEGALFDSLSVYDNVAFRLHEQGVPEEEVEPEVRRMLRFVNLEDAIDKMPIELSGGMRRRVGIARALVGDPKIVMFDEPTAGLDPPTARTICELAIKLRDLEDVSSIFVTHEMNNLEYLSLGIRRRQRRGRSHLREGRRAALPDQHQGDDDARRQAHLQRHGRSPARKLTTATSRNSCADTERRR